MKSFKEYITESDGLSDNEIWYRCGVHALNWMMSNQAKNIINKYHLYTLHLGIYPTYSPIVHKIYLHICIRVCHLM